MIDLGKSEWMRRLRFPALINSLTMMAQNIVKILTSIFSSIKILFHLEKMCKNETTWIFFKVTKCGQLSQSNHFVGI